MHLFRVLGRLRGRWTWAVVLGGVFAASAAGGLWIASLDDGADTAAPAVGHDADSPTPAVIALPTAAAPPANVDNFCAGLVLPELTIHIAGGVVSGEQEDAPNVTLFWAPGYTLQERAGRPAVIAPSGELVAEDGTALRDVGVCVMRKDGGVYLIEDHRPEPRAE